MPLTPGTRLGPYKIVAPVGAGGMGEVYRATDLRIRRQVAIKVLASRHSPDQLLRFQQEARAVGALNHPNIVALFDVGQHDGMPFVVCELLDGKTLREHLRAGPLRLRKALEYAIQIGEALAAAHDRGIHHRDLKPGNVFITTEGRVKLLDFGLAKSFETKAAADATTMTQTGPVTNAGMILGTPGYMPPEQIHGRATDHRSDLFAFGCILYEMLAGSPAFGGPSSFAALGATVSDDVAPLSQSGRKIPAPVEEIVRHCLEKDPTERFQSARDLVFDLRGALRALDTVPPPASGARPALWIAAAVISVLAVGLGSAAMLWLLSGARPLPTFSRVTFHLGTVVSARFAPHEQAIVYTAAWDRNETDVFLSLPNTPEPRSLEHAGAKLLAISPAGEMAMAAGLRYAGGERYLGRLVTLPWSGGSGREVLEHVEYADWSPDGRLAVVRSDGVSFETRLEYPVGTVLVTSTGGIRDPRVSPDGDVVAFLDDSTGLGLSASVAIVDLRGRKTALTDEHTDAHGLAWAPAGNEIWFTADAGAGRALHAVARGGQERLIAQVPGSLTLQDIAADGRVLATRDDERNGILALPPGESEERELSWLGDSGLADLARDGRTVLFGDHARVYLRRTDGSAPMRLGDGYADALSPDAKWALTTAPSMDRLTVTPTGVGQARPVPSYGVTSYAGAAWFPDGERILFNGRTAGSGLRCYVQHLDGHDARPITPEGTWCLSVAPDGQSVVAIAQDTGIWLYQADGNGAREVPGSEPGDRPAGWTADGRALWVFRRGEVPACIHRLDVASGRRTRLRCVVPRDATGVRSVTDVRVTPDGKSYAYSYRRVLSELYVVRGWQ